MLMMTKKSNLSDSVDYQWANNEFSECFTRDRDRCFVTSEYVTAVKAMHTTTTQNMLLASASDV